MSVEAVTEYGIAEDETSQTTAQRPRLSAEVNRSHVGDVVEFIGPINKSTSCGGHQAFWSVTSCAVNIFFSLLSIETVNFSRNYSRNLIERLYTEIAGRRQI